MKGIVIIILTSIITIHIKGQDTAVADKTPVSKKNSQSEYRTNMRAGNKLYESGKPVEAETAYRKALDADNKASKAAFNLGDALYKQKKYDEAGKQFEIAAADMSAKEDKARAYHNLGNSFLQQQKFQESINAYKQALRNNPKDADTKYNLSYAINMLKQQQKEQEKRQNQPEEDKEADKIFEQAKKLVAQRKYQEAYDLMKEGEKKYPKLLQHSDFTNRVLDIIKII